MVQQQHRAPDASADPATPTGETRLALVRRARKINRLLAEAYPDAHCELNYRNAYELLVATILSAQCTDARVNLVTPALFDTYPNPAALAASNRVELENLIRSTGFYRNKAASLQAMAQQVCDEHQGEIPRTLDQLTKLAGVGRKTANVVLGNAFDVPGITVDTHVGRIARRLGWTDKTDPVAAEHEIGNIFPKREWTMLCHRLIFHGRRCCTSRSPQCDICPIAHYCPSKRLLVAVTKEK